MKNILVTLFCLSTFISFSQMTLAKIDGTPINNGDIFTYNVADETESYLGIKIFNSSSSNIKVRVECVSITNATGSGVQLCFGDVCVANITAGNSYPSTPSVIAANSSNGNFDHFLNTNTGINPNLPVEYAFRFYQVDDNGIEIGNTVSFTYRYNGSLSNQSFSNQLSTLGVSLKSNIVTNSLEIEASKNTQMSMYDINGKLVREQNLNSGSHSIDTSILNSGTYILSFRNNEGQTATSKIIKK